MNKPASSLTEQDFVRLPADRSMADAIVRPSVSYWRDVLRRIRSDKVAIVSLTFLVIIILMAIFAPILSPYGYETTDLLHTNQPPSAEHWFGTDAGGRDLWTRVWVGARISLIIGLGGAIVPQIIDVGVCIPSLVYVTLIMLWLDAGPVAIIIAIAITGWMDSARVVRGRMLQFKNREFVLAASTLGASPIRIIFRHILPNILGQQVVNISSAIPAAIFLEAYLSFIGLGIKSPMTSWGQLCQVGSEFYRLPLPAVYSRRVYQRDHFGILSVRQLSARCAGPPSEGLKEAPYDEPSFGRAGPACLL